MAAWQSQGMMDKLADLNQAALFALLASAAIASAGLWWFRFILKSVKNLPTATRYGIYALVWLAYFILTLIVVANASIR